MVRRTGPAAEARPVRRVQVGGFTVTEGVHHHGSELPWHHHETPTICFVLQGAFTEMWRGGSIACTSSTLKITPAGDRHCDQFSRGDVRGLLIEADDAQVVAIRPHSAVLDERVSFHGGLVAGMARRVYEEMRRMDAAAPLAIEGLLLELVASASRLNEQNGSSDRPRWLDEARDRIHVELAARPSLTGLAASVGVHPVTLARAFRRAFGCTVGEYVRRLRIERAARQLADTDLSLAEIALAEGFSDQSHFSNLFRRHTGLSPFQFRNTVRPR
ncbi:MAG TPA: AraC family transcriptional regulator [Gemmatimonadales bacterium]|nr:AraC family transcriptional regulator [Gemmatimonadales bacterium]